MKQSIPFVLGFVLVTLIADSAWAQRGRRSGNVSTPYGQFSAAEMSQAGGNPLMAQQLREQKMMMQYEQQLFKQQQLSTQQQLKRQEFLKKHPEAAKALTTPARTGKKSTSKAEKKGKSTTSDAAASTTKKAS